MKSVLTVDIEYTALIDCTMCQSNRGMNWLFPLEELNSHLILRMRSYVSAFLDLKTS